MIAAMPDAILALHVNSTKLRNADLVQNNAAINHVEDIEQGTHNLLITAVDDSENVGYFKFDQSNEANPTYCMRQTNIKKAGGDVSSLKDKSLFGMQYPYFICGYGQHVAVSTDYGICVLKFND